MKSVLLHKFFATSVALAGLLATPDLRAQTSVFIAGGNASQTVLFDRVTNVLNGTTPALTKVTSSANSAVRTFVGSIAGQSGLGTVTIGFSLLGAAQGLQDLSQQNTEQEAVTASTSTPVVPTLAVSSASPTAVGVSPTGLSPTKTLAIPYAFVKNPALSPNLAGVTNLTARQAAYLEGAAGTLPSAFFGGSSTADTVYLVPRNTASAVRTEIDANINFTGTISAWTTNATGGPVPDPNGGQNSGGAVTNILVTLTNAIGTVAAQNIDNFTPLAFEGVPYSVTNVENGSYPLWFYENWFTISSGQGAPSANQLIVINALLNTVTNIGYQTTNTVFVGNFVPLSGLQVTRPSDGGAIQSLLY